jgi:hypothetical protein
MVTCVEVTNRTCPKCKQSKRVKLFYESDDLKVKGATRGWAVCIECGQHMTIGELNGAWNRSGWFGERDSHVTFNLEMGEGLHDDLQDALRAARGDY